MARKVRIEFPGAIYHVYARGNNKQKIFGDDSDYFTYLNRLTRYQKRYDFFLYSFVLMPNHVHFIIETKEIPLSKIMQGLQQSYTIYFHKKYETLGHLFQGRYQAILCDREDYLLALVRYLHLNPIRSGLVESLEEYYWSSHQVFIGKSIFPIIKKELILALFSNNEEKAINEYFHFLSDGMKNGGQSDDIKITDQYFHGSKKFIEQVKEKNIDLNRSLKELSSTIQKNSLDEKTIEKILKIVSKITKVSPECILSRSRQKTISFARLLFICVAVKYVGFANKTIADFIEMDQSNISNSIRRIDEKMSNDNDFVNCLEIVLKVLNV
ncbi:transposase [Acidobacteriota bacterium]